MGITVFDIQSALQNFEKANVTVDVNELKPILAKNYQLIPVLTLFPLINIYLHSSGTIGCYQHWHWRQL
jgi:hypothetical protein